MVGEGTTLYLFMWKDASSSSSLVSQSVVSPFLPSGGDGSPGRGWSCTISTGQTHRERIRSKEAGDGQGELRKGTFSLQPTALRFKLQRSYPQLPCDKSTYLTVDYDKVTGRPILSQVPVTFLAASHTVD